MIVITSLKPRKLWSLLLVVAAISIAIAGTAIGTYSIKKSSKVPSIQDREPTHIRMIRFTLFEDGIFPREFHAQKGLINLTLEDNTGTSDGLIVERIDSDQRTPIEQVRRSHGQARGRSLLRLGPGSYRLYDASRPANTARLVIEP